MPTNNIISVDNGLIVRQSLFIPRQLGGSDQDRSVVLSHTMNYYSMRQMATSAISQCEYNTDASQLARMHATISV